MGNLGSFCRDLGLLFAVLPTLMEGEGGTDEVGARRRAAPILLPGQ